MRRENIAKVWPLTPAAASKSDNIRKFEEVGTHPAANHNAIGEALGDSGVRTDSVRGTPTACEARRSARLSKHKRVVYSVGVEPDRRRVELARTRRSFRADVRRDLLLHRASGGFDFERHGTRELGQPGSEPGPGVGYASRTALTRTQLLGRRRAGKREAKFVGTPVANYFRKPYGPGWALVGDAGYNRDYITAMGIMDAFLSAELCADALHQTFSGTRPFEDAMGDYRRARDERVQPIFEFTCQVATLEPPPPQLQQVLGAAHGNQEAMDGFARVNAGVTSPAEFFSPENVGRIFAAAGKREHRV